MPSASARSSGLSIGELAKRTGCKVQTIRYYAQIDLMPEQRRTGGDQRLYSEDHLNRLTFIRLSRELGLPLLKTELERMLQQCGHGRVAECRVIEVLADHSKCVSHSQSGAAKSI